MFLIIIYINLFVIIFAKTLPRFESNSMEAEKTALYWTNMAKDSILKAYNQKDITHKAKNVILFLGDGMGISTITPSRILKGQLQNTAGEEAKLVFEDFPNTCLIKNYNIDYQVPDSAGTATAFLTGVKTNKGVLGVTANVSRGETNCERVQDNLVTSIFALAIKDGKSTGIVTTARITHATPAAGYASIADRDWEGSMTPEAAKNSEYNGKECKDIGRQLVENYPGKDINVLFGGGAKYLYPKNYTNPITQKPGEREDGQNMVEKWLKYREETGLKQEQYTFVDDREHLLQANNSKDLEYLFGIFQDSHVSYDKERDQNKEPSLEEMTETAINILQKNDNGYVLLVEGGRIDTAHHDNFANLALYETIAFDKAIESALRMVSTDDTLVVVTADHSHAFTMNGYPLRGNDIRGIADNDEETNKPFTTLMYANGPGYKRDRPDPSKENTYELKYQSLSAVWLEESNHGGEDVALYSIGPMSHLFGGTKEQNYVAHVMEFAACLGPYSDSEHCKYVDNSSVTSQKTSIYLLIALNILIIFIKQIKL